MMHEVNLEQQRILEGLAQEAERRLGHGQDPRNQNLRDQDLLDVAVEAATAGLIKGLDVDQAREKMWQAVRRAKYDLRMTLLNDVRREGLSQPPERIVGKEAQKVLGEKWSALLTPEETSALVDAYGLDPESYGWDRALLPQLSAGESRDSLHSALEKIRQAAGAGRLNELDALSQ